MRSRCECGAALIAALWLLVTISLVGLQVGLEGRTSRTQALGLVETTMASAAAGAGSEHALGRLWTAIHRPDGIRDATGRVPTLDPWERPGRLLPDTVDLGRARYRVEIRDLGASIHLNHVDQAGIERLLASLRVDHRRAQRIARGILDWRDADRDARGGGEERDAYLEAARPIVPPDRPFSRVAEVRFVDGMDQDLYERVRPYFRTLGAPQVNLNTAPPEVLSTLPGVGPRVVASIVAHRRRGRFTRVEELLEIVPIPIRRAVEGRLDELRTRVSFDVREVEVRSRAWLPGTSVSVVEQSLISRGAGRVFVTLRRRA